jgi:hypothetical protein
MFVSVETPYNTSNPFKLWRNIQFAVQCNTFEASLGHTTWAPHLCNTQMTFCGIRGFFGDTFTESLFRSGLFTHSSAAKYNIGRAPTLKNTNRTRQDKCDAVIVYTNLGISSGMQSAIDAATAVGKPVLYRQLPAVVYAAQVAAFVWAARSIVVNMCVV